MVHERSRLRHSGRRGPKNWYTSVIFRGNPSARDRRTASGHSIGQGDSICCGNYVALLQKDYVFLVLLRIFIEPADDLHCAVEVLHKRGAAFDPVAAVEVVDSLETADRRIVNMPADDPVDAVLPCGLRDAFLVVADELYGVLDLSLQKLRERPVPEAEEGSYRVQTGVQVEGEVVGPVSEEGEPTVYRLRPRRTRVRGPPGSVSLRGKCESRVRRS